MSSPSRRAVIGAALSAAACNRPEPARALAPALPALPALRTAAPFPVGTAVRAEQLADPNLGAFIASQFSQATAEWQMKMEYIVQDDGSLRFTAPDAIAEFAKRNGMRLFGHTLVWHAQKPAAFTQLDPARATFSQAYASYITAVVGRYRGRAVGWDVVNEAVAEDGEGWRASLWSERLGAFEHMRLAFELARAADPDARLFINDYNLEYLPAKRTTFLKLAEALLKAGAPLGGLGTQTHIGLDLAPGAIAGALRDLASLGLPLHISEMDVSVVRHKDPAIGGAEPAARQSALYAEAAHAFMALPPNQRFAMTFWGVRDRDSWLRSQDGADAPLLFDDSAHPKPDLQALEAALRS
jgi:endo-1,4-beta-xylanase